MTGGDHAPGLDAFARLRALTRDTAPPPGLPPILLHLGEQQLAVPEAILGEIGAGAPWSRYPTLGGDAALRSAYAGWLDRRFHAGGALAAGRIACEPTPGSKQAVAVAVLLAEARAREADPARRPVIVMPNPFYPTYLAATRAAGARAAFYDPSADDVVQAVAAAAADGPVAAVILCSPASPSGALVEPRRQRALAGLAHRLGALLIVDECYVDLGLGADIPGFAELLAEGVEGRALVLHTLSKRSGAPGLRSGFAVGDPESVAAYAAYNRSCGVSLPQPVAAVSAALWRDDDHVAALRAALGEAWAVADEALCRHPGYGRPASGFFLWLPAEDDEATALALWRSAGLLVMPGRYLGVEGPDGRHPGRGHLRIALVHRPAVLREALTRLTRALA